MPTTCLIRPATEVGKQMKLDTYKTINGPKALKNSCRETKFVQTFVDKSMNLQARDTKNGRETATQRGHKMYGVASLRRRLSVAYAPFY